MLLKEREDMHLEENLSKRLYKTELYLLKILPALLALFYLVNIILSYFNIDIPVLSYIAGVSFIPLIFMYISSYVFKFCKYHRMFLHYILINNILNIYDLYIGIPITNRGLFIINLIIAGITLFIIVFLYVKNNKRVTVKNSR